MTVECSELEEIVVVVVVVVESKKEIPFHRSSLVVCLSRSVTYNRTLPYMDIRTIITAPNYRFRLGSFKRYITLQGGRG